MHLQHFQGIHSKKIANLLSFFSLLLSIIKTKENLL